MARFRSPVSLAADRDSNVYVADAGNSVIRRISRDGVVETFAGTAGQTGSADGVGAAARFYGPANVGVDEAGNVYVLDAGRTAIRKITPARAVTTLWRDRAASDGEDRLDSTAQSNEPTLEGVDRAGNVLILDAQRESLRLISPAGTSTTLESHQPPSERRNTSVREFADLAVDHKGYLYVTNAREHTVLKITPAGAWELLAGSAGQSGSTDAVGAAARFGWPGGIAADSTGELWVTDRDNCTVRKITPAGVVTTFAGTAGHAGVADGAPSSARLYRPTGIVLDRAGNAYVTDPGAAVIRRIAPSGAVTTFAGRPGQGGAADGPGSEARFDVPQGLAIDRSGNLYVADSGNHLIRRISPRGIVTTVAGAAGQSGRDDGLGSAARFKSPSGVAVDRSGTLYVADEGNYTIRKISPQGAVTTFAGAAGHSGSADAAGADARFRSPRGIAVDRDGTVYVADYESIRKITPAGAVTTLTKSTLAEDTQPIYP